MKDFVGITESEEVCYEIKKSKFFVNVCSVQTEEEARNFVQKISTKHSGATHNCYAYVLQNTAKASDDGEPSGTAGKPILDILTKRNFKNVACVVSRYFGGIKLGAGGLVRAYKNSTVLGLDNAKTTNFVYCKQFCTQVDYGNQSSLENFLKNFSATFTKQFGDKVTYNVIIKNEQFDANAFENISQENNIFLEEEKL